MIEILGVPFSAHTRKVILAAIHKRIPYRVVPTIPLDPPPGWRETSPLGKIPVLRHEGTLIRDSSVILAYLDVRFPKRPLIPAGPADRARALWIEEYVDSGLSPHVLGGLLLQRVFAPRFLNQEPDEQLIQRSIEVEIPGCLTYLEGELGGDHFVGETWSVADIAVVSMLMNLGYAGERVDREKFPKLHRYLERCLSSSLLQTAIAAEIPAAREIPGLDTGLTVGQQAAHV